MDERHAVSESGGAVFVAMMKRADLAEPDDQVSLPKTHTPCRIRTCDSSFINGLCGHLLAHFGRCSLTVSTFAWALQRRANFTRRLPLG